MSEFLEIVVTSLIGLLTLFPTGIATMKLVRRWNLRGWRGYLIVILGVVEPYWTHWWRGGAFA